MIRAIFAGVRAGFLCTCFCVGVLAWFGGFGMVAYAIVWALGLTR